MDVPRRLRRLPTVSLSPSPAQLAGRNLRLACHPLARLLGLAGLRMTPAHVALLFPRTRSVHTLGMRFALDLIWLDRDGHVVRVDRGVQPWRVRSCRSARAVVELPSRADA